MSQFAQATNISSKVISHERGEGYIFHSPEGGRAAEAFQSLFSHIDGKIRDGYGRKVVGTAEVATDPAIALSVILDIPRCDGVGNL
jgi:hypothetical protein